MIDPKREHGRDEKDETTERTPEREPEALKDLTPKEGEADDVKGGRAVPGTNSYCRDW